MKTDIDEAAQLNSMYVEFETLVDHLGLSAFIKTNFKSTLKTAIAIFPELINKNLEKLLSVSQDQLTDDEYQALLLELALDVSLVTATSPYKQLTNSVGDILLGDKSSQLEYTKETKKYFKALTTNFTDFLTEVSTSLPALIRFEVLSEKTKIENQQSVTLEIPCHSVSVLVGKNLKTYVYQASLGEFSVGEWIHSQKFQESQCGCLLETYMTHLIDLMSEDATTRTRAYQFLFNLEGSEEELTSFIESKLSVKYHIETVDSRVALRTIQKKIDDIIEIVEILAGKDCNQYMLEVCWEHLLNQEQYQPHKDKIRMIREQINRLCDSISCPETYL
jgi:hypothetical protein